VLMSFLTWKNIFSCPDLFSFLPHPTFLYPFTCFSFYHSATVPPRPLYTHHCTPTTLRCTDQVDCGGCLLTYINLCELKYPDAPVPCGGSKLTDDVEVVLVNGQHVPATEVVAGRAKLFRFGSLLLSTTPTATATAAAAATTTTTTTTTTLLLLLLLLLQLL
jgi:hypothetical protein